MKITKVLPRQDFCAIVNRINDYILNNVMHLPIYRVKRVFISIFSYFYYTVDLLIGGLMTKQTGDSQFSDKDQAYIKKYIESHADNRMAWYLLGKKYEQAGEMSKAHYCFNQSGDIYKAFENEPLPQEAQAEKIIQRQEENARRLQEQKRRRTWTRILMLAVCLVLLMLLNGVQDELPFSNNNEAGQPTIEGVKPSSPDKPSRSDHGNVYLSGDTEGEIAKSLLAAVKRTTSTLTPSYVVSQPMHDNWRIWTLEPKAWYAAHPSNKGGEADVTALQAEDCDCSVEQGLTHNISQSWALAEQRILQARSMIVSTVGLGRKPPEEMGRLAGGYPNNYISGVDQELIPYYENALQDWKDAGSPSDPGAASKALFEGASQGNSPFTEEMRIIIDRQTYQLAVVSGDQIIRQYRVGLGGERTPEGKFIISEKVVNPNGRADGAFGSRGMTLSNTLYAIHGTDEPDSMGKDESLGCIRMTKEDVEELFDLVPMGTEVIITKDKLPEAANRPMSEPPYRVPLTSGQENPNKIYKWLD